MLPKATTFKLRMELSAQGASKRGSREVKTLQEGFEEGGSRRSQGGLEVVLGGVLELFSTYFRHI